MDINLTPILLKNMAGWPRTRGRYSPSEIYFLLNGSTTPEQWLNKKERTVEEILKMWAGIGVHNQLEALLGPANSEIKKVYEYKDIVIAGKADYLPPNYKDEVWEFKTSTETMKQSKPWHDHQVKLYCTMFEKSIGRVYQPVQDKDGIYLRNIGTVERDDVWFEKEMEKLHDFHIDVERFATGADKAF